MRKANSTYLWQSPKSIPQSLTVLSALAVTMTLPSREMSMERTGKEWPYMDTKNFILYDDQKRNKSTKEKD